MTTRWSAWRGLGRGRCPSVASRDRRAAEAVGLDRIGAGVEMAEMDVAHDFGPRFAQQIDIVLVAAIIALDVELARLSLGAHGAIAQQDAVG